MPDFRKLIVWQKAHVLSLRLDAVADRIALKNPDLARQLERAGAAIPAAIAEGRGRATDKDFARYVSIGIGESTEVENHLQRAYDKRLISRAEYVALTRATIEVRKMLVGLRNALNGIKRDTAWLTAGTRSRLFLPPSSRRPSSYLQPRPRLRRGGWRYALVRSRWAEPVPTLRAP
jgi:four helix bundle protein